MARVLAIVRRDLVRFLRNPVRTALLFAIPVVLAGLFALVFGTGGGAGVTLDILLWDEDDSLLSRLLEGAGARPEADGRLRVTRVGPEGLAMMERGEASALVHLPAGFTEAYLTGEPVRLELVKNPAERFLPQVVEEGVTLGAGVLSLASVVLRDELATLHGFAGADAAPPDAAVAALSVGFNQKARELGRFVLPPVIRLETAVGEEAEPARNEPPTITILTLFLPGLAMLGVLFIAQTATRDLQRDRAAGLVRHLLTSPVTTLEYLTGKCLSVLAVTVLAFAFLIGLGAAVGIRWGDPLAVAGLVLASSVAASGLLLALMSVARGERQGDALSTIVIIVAAMLGGAFLPLPAMPDFMMPAARLSPVYWSVSGFNEVALEGGGVASVAPNLAVLTLAGGLLLVLGAAVLRRRIAAGAR